MKAHREQGSVAILAAFVLPLAIGIGGLALELSMAFQRQAELQQLADSVALSAALQLDGTSAGITTAIAKASQSALNHNVRGVGIAILNPAALSFAGDPGGPWLDSGTASAAPSGLLYVRADMGAMDSTYTSFSNVFGNFLGVGDSITVGARAVAGPNGVRVLPLAVCAPNNVPTATRANGGGVDERVDYGFRFGVGYNLLALNPAAGAGSGEYFLVDPVSPPGSSAVSGSTTDSQVAPFMCSGKLAYPSVAGRLHLRRNGSFALWRQLNSRFNSYGGSDACSPYSAPPDSNVREFRGSQDSWMSSNPPQASAASSTPAAGKPLVTVADGAAPLPAIAPAQYGTLWAYGAARKSNSSNSFGTANWAKLYPSTPAFTATGTSWSAAAPPYGNTAFTTAPTGNPARKERRLLYVPLLSCPVNAGTNVDGSVLAVARFLLTAQASASEVPGEFAGILSARELAALKTDVELLQ